MYIPLFSLLIALSGATDVESPAPALRQANLNGLGGLELTGPAIPLASAAPRSESRLTLPPTALMESSHQVVGSVFLAAAGKAHPVGSDSGGTTKKETIINSMRSDVSKLEARLAEADLNHKQRLAAREAEYQHRLISQRQDNTATVSEHANLLQDIKNYRDENSKLRSQADTLRKTNRVWSKDLSLLRQNISTALEFASGALGELSEVKRPDLAVLEELDESDARRIAKETEKSKQDSILGGSGNEPQRVSISKKSMGLLQFPEDSTSKEMLEMLDASFNDLADEHKKSEDELAAIYKDQFKEAHERQDALLSEQKQLNETKTTLMQLNSRLKTAVHHLQEVGVKLQDRARSLRMYAQRLGIRKTPTVRVGVTQQTEPATGQEIQPHDAIASAPEANVSGANVSAVMSSESSMPNATSASQASADSNATGDLHAKTKWLSWLSR